MRAHLAPFAILTALLGCADAPDASGVALPEGQVPPARQTMTLSMDPLIPGEPVNIRVTGALPNRQVYVMRSTRGPGAGDCLPFLLGNCMDILAPYTLTLEARADAQGVATWSLARFPSLPPTDIWFQAVQFTPTDANESPVLFNPVVAPCLPDTFEDNDTLFTASPLVAGAYTDLTSCPEDEDFYLLSVPPGQVLVVDVLFSDDLEGDIDAELLSGPGAVLASGTSITDDEHLEWHNTGTRATPVGLGVYNFFDVLGQQGVPYDLDVRVLPPQPCVDDGLEDNDTLLTARPMPGPTLLGTSCAGDSDFYAVDANAGDVLRASAGFDPDDGVVEIVLYGPSGAVITSDNLGQPVEVLAVAGAAGRYVVEVRHVADNPLGGGVAYDLGFSATPPAPCPTDAYEPNDGPSGARRITAPGSYSAVGCTSDADLFSIVVAPGDEISVELTHAPLSGTQDVDVALYDNTGALLDDTSLFNATSPETAVAYADYAGPMFIEIVTPRDDPAGGGVAYTFDVTRRFVAPCVPDPFEPNDSLATAAPLTAGVYPGLTACTPQQGAGAGGDYFAIALRAGQTLDADVLFTDAEGDIDVDLYDFSGRRVAFSSSTSDNESVGYTAAFDQTVILRVKLYLDDGAGQAGNTYDLEVSVTP